MEYSTESSLSFPQYLSILKRRCLPASFVFISVLTLAILITFRQKPVYEAEAKLLLKKISPTSSIIGLGKEIGEFAPLGNQTNPLSTEIEVIRSSPIIQKTITQLNLTDEEGKTIKLKDFLKKLSVSNIRGTDMLEVSYQDKQAVKAAKVVNTLIAIYIENNQIINRAEAFYTREFIEKKLPDAEVSVRHAEGDMRRFKEENKIVFLQEETKAAVEVMAYLEQKIALSKAELADANAQSLTFQKELQMNRQQALAATSLNDSPGVQEALREYQQVESKLTIERTRFLDTHPIITDLEIKEAKLKSLLQQRIQQSVGEQPQLSNQSLQIGQVKPKLIEQFINIEAKRQGLSNQVYALSRERDIYKERINILPKLEQQQRELESKLQASQSTYTLLLQKLQEIRIAENQNIGNARLIQSAVVPDEPVASRKSFFVVIGFFMGSLLSITTALILEATDKFIRHIEEAKEIFGFAVLGVIPYHKKYKNNAEWGRKLASFLPDGKTCDKQKDNLKNYNRNIVVRDTPDCPTSTAYRMLYANLKFLSSERDIKTIVVTSSVSKEGKSTICANLAVAMANIGRQVLLIDADMPDPLQHEIWQLPNQVGLSNLISEQADPKKAIKEVMMNLEVLTSGVTPTNSTALLDSPKISSLLGKLSVHYDLIIIDAPSLKASTDALMLGKMADGILFVTRLGAVDYTNANFAKEFLQKTGQNIIGQVIGFPKM